MERDEPLQPGRSIAALVSDYVGNRLDWLSARQVEAAARRDATIAEAIEHARAVRRRVKQRLAHTR